MIGTIGFWIAPRRGERDQEHEAVDGGRQLPAHDAAAHAEGVEAGGDALGLVAELRARDHAVVLVAEQGSVGAVGRAVLDQAPVGGWMFGNRAGHRVTPS